MVELYVYCSKNESYKFHFRLKINVQLTWTSRVHKDVNIVASMNRSYSIKRKWHFKYWNL